MNERSERTVALDPSVGLTSDELFVLDLLASAWNKWLLLDGRDTDDDSEFRHAIHECQHIVGMRVARRADPKIWRQRITPNDGAKAPDEQREDGRT